MILCSRYADILRTKCLSAWFRDNVLQNLQQLNCVGQSSIQHVLQANNRWPNVKRLLLRGKPYSERHNYLCFKGAPKYLGFRGATKKGKYIWWKVSWRREPVPYVRLFDRMFPNLSTLELEDLEVHNFTLHSSIPLQTMQWCSCTVHQFCLKQRQHISPPCKKIRMWNVEVPRSFFSSTVGINMFPKLESFSFTGNHLKNSSHLTPCIESKNLKHLEIEIARNSFSRVWNCTIDQLETMKLIGTRCIAIECMAKLHFPDLQHLTFCSNPHLSIYDRLQTRTIEAPLLEYLEFDTCSPVALGPQEWSCVPLLRVLHIRAPTIRLYGPNTTLDALFLVTDTGSVNSFGRLQRIYARIYTSKDCVQTPDPTICVPNSPCLCVHEPYILRGRPTAAGWERSNVDVQWCNYQMETQMETRSQRGV